MIRQGPNVALQARAACGASWNRRLDGNCYTLTQELGREVRAIRPGERMVRDRQAFELLNVSERAKNGPVEFSGEIHFASSAIAEPQLYHVVPNVPRLKNVKKHSLAHVALSGDALACRPA